MITVEKWEDYQVEELKSQQQINNKATTNQHKQECKEIYLYLFNKYKEQIEKEHANRKIQIISACQSCKEYEELSAEEQDKLFYALMSIEKKFK